MAIFIQDVPGTNQQLPQLAVEVHRRHRALIRQLRIEVADGGVILEGEAYCFYGKQMAQEEIRRRGHRVICNRMRVDGENGDCCSRASCSCEIH